MTEKKLCTCPPEPPIQYGRSWLLTRDFSSMWCSVCGGEPRPEQDAEMAKEWGDYMDKKANGGPSKLGGGW